MTQAHDHPGVATIVERPDAIEVSMPTKGRWQTALVLCVMVLFITGIEIWMLAHIVGTIGREPASLGSFALGVGGTLMWLFVCYRLAFELVGREHLVVGSTHLTTRYEVCGTGVTRRYDLHRVRNLRPMVPRDGWENITPYQWYYAALGSIAFDYGRWTIRIGSAVPEPEARRVVRQITERRPQIGADASR